MHSDEDVYLRLNEIIDVNEVNKMIEAYCNTVNISVAIIDAFDKSVLCSAGWQSICTNFHHANSVACDRCVESFLGISEQLKQGETAGYRCCNGLWVIGTPIIVEGRHIASMLLGQFLYEGETANPTLTNKQAEESGFDQTAYLDALSRVPVFSWKKVEDILVYNKTYARFLGHLAENILSQREEFEKSRMAEISSVENVARLTLAMDIANLVSWEFDMATLTFTFNDQHYAFLGTTAEQEGGYKMLYTTYANKFIHPEDAWVVYDEISKVQNLNSGGSISNVSHRIIRRDGQERYIIVRYTVISDSTGQSLKVLGTSQDITEHKLAEHALMASQAKLNLAMEAAHVANWEMDLETEIFTFNDQLYALYATTAEREGGYKMPRETYINTFIHPDDLWLFTENERRARIASSPQGGVTVDHRIVRRDGEVRYISVCYIRLDDPKGSSRLIGTNQDITERKKAEERIHLLAYYDQLTLLPNRFLLMERLRRTMGDSSLSGTYCALLLVDLDDFKTLNDTYGHEIGDLLLQQVTRRLESCAQPGATVARLGGDEFLVMLVDLGLDEKCAAAQAEGAAAKISDALRQAFQLNLEKYHCTSSIGICLFRGAGTDSETLLKRVELAMYRAKQDGRNQTRVFDPDMEEVVTRRASLAMAMRDALQEKQFVLYYQPQIAGTQLVGAEALVRWQHPQRGMVSPGEFIPLAEETGLIVPLGRWVLESACAQLVKWSSLPCFTHLSIAVNVSVQQFNQDNFVEQVFAILQETGANPKLLKLELTESLMASEIEIIVEKMHVLKGKGINFSLDDFGTGYSSLTYLKRLPFDQLKIDQTFVRELLISPDDASIAKTIIELGANLGIGVIAEGVETAEHQAFLAEQGCNVYQGYFFGRPMPINEFEKWRELNKK